jgi:hypothetical protein
MADRGHQGAAYEDCRRYVMRVYDDCFRCARGVDKTLSGRHPWGPSLDLVIPHKHGGPMTRENSRLSHMRCNSAYRDGRRMRPLTTQRVVRRGRYQPSGTC